MIKLYAKVLLDDPEGTDEWGNLIVLIEALEWQPVEWLDPWNCEHQETMCVHCVDTWACDHEIILPEGIEE